MRDFDIVIVGSGFSGSLLAMIARRLGKSTLLVESGTHPRFAIGESTSPLANLLLEELATRYDLPRLLPLATYGAWQRAYPHITCGLKRGFTYYHHTRDQPYCPTPNRSRELMVAASPHDELADTHWLRADVDEFLLNEALALGVEYQDETRLSHAETETDGDGMLLRGERHGKPFAVRARFVVDSSGGGPQGFLCHALRIPPSDFSGYPLTQSLFSHFTKVRRCDELATFRGKGADDSPYPPDDAALHHVFDGGWMWVLRFGNGVTSAGIALTKPLADELNLAEGEPAWHRFLARFPSIGETFRDAHAVQPFRYAPRLAHRASQIVGQNWALMPSSAAFVDPLFSTGIPLTLLGIERLARIFELPPSASQAATLAAYERATLDEADRTARFIAACYGAFANFDRFAALSQFYFASASFAEMARRLHRPHLAPFFLAGSDPAFQAEIEWCGRNLDSSCCDFNQHVARAIAPRNIAGLHDPAKKNWYGVDLEDVVHGAAKFGMTPDAVREIIASAAWAKPAPAASEKFS